MRVNLECLVEVGGRDLELTRFERERSSERQRLDVVWINRQRAIERGVYFFAAVVSFVAREIQVDARAVWIQLERSLEKLRGVGILVLLREQLGGGELCVEIIGISRERFPVKIV